MTFNLLSTIYDNNQDMSNLKNKFILKIQYYEISFVNIHNALLECRKFSLAHGILCLKKLADLTLLYTDL